MIVFFIVQWFITSKNEEHYNVAVTNELKSEEFRSALGGLMRIKHEKNEQRVIVSRDAQEKAFSVSPTFAQLKPYLSGESKMIASFYIWRLRSAVRRAGYYNNPDDATREFEFYRKMGEEIRLACDARELDCYDRKASIRPVWHDEYNRQILPVLVELAKTALTFSLFKPSSLTHEGSREDIDTLFNYNLLTGENSLRMSMYFKDKLPAYYIRIVAFKEKIMAVLGVIYKYLVPVLFLIAIGIHFFGILSMVINREPATKSVIGLMILGSVLAVLILLTFIKITIWPVIRPMHTLSPILLLYIMFMLIPQKQN